jgi:signal recognition particle subunit SRP54
MTEGERRDPATIDEAGRQRIAVASGVDVKDVSRFLAQFRRMQTIMQQMGDMRFPGI